MTNIIEAIKDFFIELISYIRHGEVDSVAVATSVEDVEIARSIQRQLIGAGFSCRVITGEEITLDADSIAIQPGRLVILTQYKGHVFVRPGITATIARAN